MAKREPQWQVAQEKARERQGQKRKWGKPERPLKIDDSPRIIARTLFGMPSTKFT